MATHEPPQTRLPPAGRSVTGRQESLRRHKEH